MATATLSYDPNHAPTVVASVAAIKSAVSTSAPHPVSTIQLAKSAISGVLADGKASYIITALVSDFYNSPVANQAISFSKSGNGLVVLTPSSLTTSALGIVTLTVTDIYSANDTVIISAIAGGINATTPLTLNFVGTGNGANTGNVVSLVATVNTPFLANGTAQLVAINVTDQAGLALANQVFTVTTTGSMSASARSITTDKKGKPITVLTVSDTSSETATLIFTDATGKQSFSTAVQFVAATANAISVIATPSSVVPDGVATASINAVVRDVYGVAVSNAVVDFYTQAGIAVLSQSRVITDALGRAAITVSNTSAQSVDIYASLPLNGGKQQFTTVVFEKAVGSLALVSNVISLSADNIAIATLSATVLDSKGAPLPSRTVNFTTTGRARLSTTAVTDASGVTTVTLKDAYAEVVNVVANINGFTQSKSITFTAVPKTVQLAQVPVIGSVVADGVKAYTLKVKVLDQASKAITGQLIDVYATSSKGGFVSVSPTQATADSKTGILSITVTDLYANSDTVMVWASAGTGAGQVSASTNLSFVGNAPNQPTSMGIRASQSKILTDGVSKTVLTITVQDSKNAAVSGALIDVYTTSGLLTISQIKTDKTGAATVTLSAGSNRVNTTATVLATAVGTPTVTTQIPIQITGTTLVASGIKSNLDTAGKISDTLTLTLKDGGNKPVFGQKISVTSNGCGLRLNTLATDPYTVTTDVNGVVTMTVDAYTTGITIGEKTLTATLVGGSTKATRNYNVAGAAFGITAPATDPYAMFVNDIYTVTVSNVTPATAAVTFSTTLGLLDGAVTTVTKNAVGGTASATIQSALAGIATVQVSVAGTTTQTTSMRFTISQKTANAMQVTLQAGANVVAISSGALKNSISLTATVRDVNGQPVGQSPVIFTMKNPVGGGESLSPALVQTDAFGVAKTTFISGSLSSGAQGIDIYATVVKTTGLPAVDPYSISNIVIGGTAGSVVIGSGTTMTVLDPATYQLPMSVVVADSNGNAVVGAQVTLNAWPSHYRFGYWGGTTACQLVVIPTTTGSTVVNEDINRNLTLDAGEDKSHTMASYIISSKTGYPVLSTDPYATTITGPTPAAPKDNALTPANSAAGTLPTSVTTDANGVATFNLTYLKADAWWVTTAITATTQVLGTESRGTIEFNLPYLASDIATCSLPNSPFNNPLWGF